MKAEPGEENDERLKKRIVIRYRRLHFLNLPA